MKLSDLVKILDAQDHDLNYKDIEFANLSIDTRSLQRGDFFVAIKGANFDGHDFVANAAELGACAVLVERPIDSLGIPQIVVPDTIAALGRLAVWQRNKFNIPVVAVTGTCGKTTTKEMIYAILQQMSDTLASAKSFNTNIGVPLTLWQLQKGYQYAVLEVGANHFGEIEYLTNIIKPKVAIITNAGPGHLEGFGDVRGVARAKGEIFSGLNKRGIAILNADDEYFNYWRQLISTTCKSKIVTFGLDNQAMVKAIDIKVDADGKPSFILQFPKAQAFIRLPLLGQHNVMNALAAAAACYVIGATIEAIKYGLENMHSVYRRLVKKIGLNGAEIIDDSYNAIPSAVVASLKVLTCSNKKKVFVFGGMAELGDGVEKWHYVIGQKAKELKIDSLYVCGKFADQVAAGFGDGAKIFTEKEDLINTLKKELDADKIVLIKGARSSRMEEVAEAL